MDPAVIKQLTIGALAPGFAALLVLAAVWWGGRSDSEAQRWWRVVLAPTLLFGVGSALMHAILFGMPKLPPAEALDWLPIIALVTMAVVLTTAPVRVPSAVRWIVMVLLLVGTGYVSARSLLAYAWETSDAVLNISLFTVGAMIAVVGTSLLARNRGWFAPLALMTNLVGVSQVLVLAFASLALGQVAGVFAAMLGPAFVIALWRPAFRVHPLVMALPVIVTAAAIFQGYLYTETVLPWLYVVLFILAPWIALLAEIGPIGRLRSWKRALVRLGLAVTPTAIALAIVLATREPEYVY